VQGTPFELHITIHDLPAGREDAFIDCCAALAGKPMMIELSRGDYIHQPMLNKVVYATSLAGALADARFLSTLLEAEAFPVKRVKIEVPATASGQDFEFAPDFRPYFEWHGKVKYERADTLLALCTAHQVHLSLNALKKDQDTRFVTLREFGSATLFDQRIRKLISALDAGNWPVIKQQAEYCVYDDHVILDKGWLHL